MMITGCLFFFSVQRACAYLGCKKDKALKLFAELDSETGNGLIERVKRGQGKSDLIYVMSFDLPKDAEDREEIRNLRDKSSRNDSYRPKIVQEWSDKNGDLKPGDVSYGSNLKVWWLGKCGHVWRASVKNRSNGSKCPYCSGNQVLYGVNDLESCRPEVAAEWSDRNYPMTPADFTIFANKKVWWKCDGCGYEWQARIAGRSKGHGCPVCAGAIVHEGHNDLATRYPELASEWSWKNEKPPSMYSSKSRESSVLIMVTRPLRRCAHVLQSMS